MKRVAMFLASILAAAVLLGPGPARADDSGGMVAGAGGGVFPGGAAFGGVPLSGLDFGQAVFTAPEGSAVGAFHAVLLGVSLLGQPQRITVEGKVDSGGVAGIATFSGTATLDMGDGTPSLPGVPFSVAIGGDGLQLTLDATLLPTATLSAGAVAVE